MVCTNALRGPVLFHRFFAGFSAAANSHSPFFTKLESHLVELLHIPRTFPQSSDENCQSRFIVTKTSATTCMCGELELLNRKPFSLHTEHTLHGECSCPPAALEEDPALPTSACRSHRTWGAADCSSALLCLWFQSEG